MFPTDYLNGMDVASFARRWQASIRSDTGVVLVAELHDSDVTGFIAAFPDPGDLAHMEIRTLYLEPTMQRRGIGSALLATMCNRLHALGYDTITLNVGATNRGAITFYERQGWITNGVVTPMTLGTLSTEVRTFTRTLSER